MMCSLQVRSVETLRTLFEEWIRCEYLNASESECMHAMQERVSEQNTGMDSL